MGAGAGRIWQYHLGSRAHHTVQERQCRAKGWEGAEKEPTPLADSLTIYKNDLPLSGTIQENNMFLLPVTVQINLYLQLNLKPLVSILK